MQTSTSGAPMHPRLGLILDGSVVSIQFGDAVAICAKGGYRLITIAMSTHHFFTLDSNYQDRLELKSYTDRTLGVGVIENDSALLVLTATSMMKVFVDVAKVASFNNKYALAGLTLECFPT
jgi:nuclear pore complex protein Nup133